MEVTEQCSSKEELLYQKQPQKPNTEERVLKRYSLLKGNYSLRNRRQ